jgi:hypothetical protein
MENEGIPTFIAIIASAVLIVGIMVGMAVVTWFMMFAAAA